MLSIPATGLKPLLGLSPQLASTLKVLASLGSRPEQVPNKLVGLLSDGGPLLRTTQRGSPLPRALSPPKKQLAKKQLLVPTTGRLRDKVQKRLAVPKPITKPVPTQEQLPLAQMLRRLRLGHHAIPLTLLALRNRSPFESRRTCQAYISSIRLGAAEVTK